MIMNSVKRYGFSENMPFTFSRFLSDRHNISIQSKKALGVIYLACMPILRPIFSKKSERCSTDYDLTIRSIGKVENLSFKKSYIQYSGSRNIAPYLSQRLVS